jgi:hypothetical protein
VATNRQPLGAQDVGRPGPPPIPDTLDLEEWQLVKQNPSYAQVLCAVFTLLNADMAVAAGFGESFNHADPEALVAAITSQPDPVSAIAGILDAKHKRS